MSHAIGLRVQLRIGQLPLFIHDGDGIGRPGGLDFEALMQVRVVRIRDRCRVPIQQDLSPLRGVQQG